MEMRLQKYIASCGVSSRRKAEAYVLEGRVRVNGKIVNTLGTKINAEKDEILVDGKKIEESKNLIYLMLYKPVGYITSSKDQFGRETVIDLVNVKERVVPVGRLDYDTSGLLLLTNDGELTYKLTHPKHNVEKVYIAKVKGIPTEVQLRKFRSGLKIEDYTTSKAKIKIIDKTKAECQLEITIHEGKNRQVRKMCETIGHEVIALKRVQIGDLCIGDLKKGKYRHLTYSEVKYLKNI